MTTHPRRTYLDWNASAPLRPEARAAMIAALDSCGNPSSVHAEGRRARAIVENARESVARLVGAKPEQVVFTSGASEANAQVLAGRGWGGFACSCIEHTSILDAEPASIRGSILIAAGRDGRAAIDDDLTVMLREASDPVAGERWVLPSPLLVSLQLANGETGVIQDVAALVRMVREHRPDACLHTDAAQAAGRVAIDFSALDVDAMTLSSHKLGGPKGVGALILRRADTLAPLVRGGGQERGRRAGTENVAAIAGFGAAAEAAFTDLARTGAVSRLRDTLEAGVGAITPDAVIVAAGARRLPNTSCIALPGASAETLVIALDLAGVAVSAGAACSSGRVARSPVLEAMGLPPRLAAGAIRVSLGRTTTSDEIDHFLAAWQQVTARPVLSGAA